MTQNPDATTDATADKPAAAKKRAGGLNSMLIADLKAMAGGLGIPGAGGMKKAQLVEAIKTVQAGPKVTTRSARAPRTPKVQTPAPVESGTTPERAPETARTQRPEKTAAENTGPVEKAPADKAGPAERTAPAEQPTSERAEKQDRPNRQDEQRRQSNQDRQARQQTKQDKQDNQPEAKQEPESGEREPARSRNRNRNRDQGKDSQNQGNQNQGQNKDQNNQNNQGQNKDQQNKDQQRAQAQAKAQEAARNQNQNQDQAGDGEDLDGEGRGRNRRRRGRERDRPRVGGRGEPDTTILEDDVLVPAAGILDVLDSYAFVRTSGYLPGADDVYVSLSMVRKLGLRRGDAVVGQVRQPREGERKEKFNPMVRIDTVNGVDPEVARHRVDFTDLTPVHPTERLRMETGPTNLVGRVIDIAAPIGKGQRGLIVAPARAGRTMFLQAIATSISTNNPECHLMVVLVDERPEEVTDFERSVKGEVISSTFDRPAADHTVVAELAIERAKRLVELGHDVVVLIDGITRLGRAYNLATPASGRVLAGGLDPAALHPPKRFFGAARNIENGGSLTILATAVVESGSAMDEAIFEEFQGASNLEIRLRRDLAEKLLFPAVDVVASGTRREDLLMGEEEVAITRKLRRVLATHSSEEGLEMLLDRLRRSQTNIEFLMQVQKATPKPGKA